MLARNVDARLHSQHRLETVAATSPDGHEHNTRATFQPPTRRPTRPRPPLAAVDVYVDDFLLLAQTRPQQRRVLRAALSAIDDVFRPVTASDPVCRQEPASRKKMLKGDAHWSTQKRMLGWDIDTERLTLNLPPHRIERLQEVLTWLRPPRKRLPRTKWHQLLGELRSMSPALPGARGLFSALQAALSHGDGRRVRLNQHIYDTAADFEYLLRTLATRSTRLPELVPTWPTHVGASDACQIGMGGVWLPVDGHTASIVWRERFEPRISRALVTLDNPSGTLSISDLELAGMIAHKDVLAQASDVREPFGSPAIIVPPYPGLPKGRPRRWPPAPTCSGTMHCINAITGTWHGTTIFLVPSMPWLMPPAADGICPTPIFSPSFNTPSLRLSRGICTGSRAPPTLP
jgi:hypothetical protein